MTDDLRARAERLMKGCAKVMAFPEKLTPSVRAMCEDSYEVARAYLAEHPADDGERKASLIEGIRHAVDMMYVIKTGHPEVTDEGWRELDDVMNHLRGTIMEYEGTRT